MAWELPELDPGSFVDYFIVGCLFAIWVLTMAGVIWCILSMMRHIG